MAYGNTGILDLPADIGSEWQPESDLAIAAPRKRLRSPEVEKLRPQAKAELVDDNAVEDFLDAEEIKRTQAIETTLGTGPEASDYLTPTLLGRVRGNRAAEGRTSASTLEYLNAGAGAAAYTIGGVPGLAAEAAIGTGLEALGVNTAMRSRDAEGNVKPLGASDLALTAGSQVAGDLVAPAAIKKVTPFVKRGVNALGEAESLASIRQGLRAGEEGMIVTPGGADELSDFEKAAQQSLQMGKPVAVEQGGAAAREVAQEQQAAAKLSSGFYKDTGHVTKRASKISELMDRMKSEEGAVRLPGATEAPPTGQLGLEGIPQPPRETRPGGFMSNFAREAEGVIGAPLALKTTVSPALLRQGFVRLITDPKAAISETANSVRAALKEVDARTMQAGLLDAPTSSRINSRGQVSDFKGFTADEVDFKVRDWGSAAPAESRAPEFQGLGQSKVSGLVQKLPHVRFSDRQYALEFNAHGLNRYGEEAQRMADMGITDKKAYDDLARVIEHQQHYGSWKQGKVPVFFSTRAISGRAQAIGDLFRLNPLDVRNPGAAREAWKGAVGMVGGNIALMYLVAEALPGFDVDTRGGIPKLKTPVGTIDPWAGWGSIARLVYDTGDLIKKDLGEGSIDDLGPDITERLARFIRGQEAPVASEVTTFATGKDVFGKPMGPGEQFDPLRMAGVLAAPMLAESIIEGYKAYGPAGALAGGGIEGLSGSINQAQTPSLIREQSSEAAAKAGLIPEGVSVDELGSGERDALDRYVRETNPKDAKKLDAPSGGIFGESRARRAEIDTQYNKDFEGLYSDLTSGKLEPSVIKEQLDDLKNKQAGQLTELYSDPEFKKAISGLPKNDMRKLEAQWFDVTNDVAAGRDVARLTSEDWDEIDKRQAAFVAKLDPDVRQRFEKNLESRDSVVSAPPIIKLKRDADTASEGYYELLDAEKKAKEAGKPYTGKKGDDWLADNPKADAARWQFYGQSLKSADAVAAVLPQAGKRPVKYAGIDRPINESAGTKELWKTAGPEIELYVQAGTPEIRDAIAKATFKGRAYDTLTDDEQSRVKDRIRNSLVKDPMLEAELIWLGRLKKPSSTATLRALTQLVDQYGPLGPE